MKNVGYGHELRDRRAGATERVAVETIRWYEKIGLVPAPPRSAGRHRRYDEPHLRRLLFIRRSRALGFTLDEVRSLLGLIAQDRDCGEVRRIASRHLEHVRRKIEDLRRVERTLADTVSRCEGGKPPECPILAALIRRAQ